MMSSIWSVLQFLLSALAADPALLVLALTIAGIGYLMIRAGRGLCDVFQKHMSSLSEQMENMAKNMQTMTDDLGKLSQSFEVHVVKTEYRIETVEKRLDRIEKIHIKEGP